MQQITTRASSTVMTIEVDGALNAVSVYDLQLILDTTARRGTQRVDLDLTRVTHIDDDGLRGLLRFCQAAIANGTILRFSGASRAAREAMRGHERPRTRNAKG
jgi:anti-anti-sigma regulatory factor